MLCHRWCSEESQLSVRTSRQSSVSVCAWKSWVMVLTLSVVLKLKWKCSALLSSPVDVYCLLDERRNEWTLRPITLNWKQHEDPDPNAGCELAWDFFPERLLEQAAVGERSRRHTPRKSGVFRWTGLRLGTNLLWASPSLLLKLRNWFRVDVSRLLNFVSIYCFKGMRMWLHTHWSG